MPKCQSAPLRWRALFDAVKELRKSRSAPADTVGCDRLFDRNAPRSTQRYQILLSLMLSSQTRDQVTAGAMERLRNLNGGCTVETINAMPQPALAELLRPVCFHNNKAKYIKETTKRLVTESDGVVPSDLDTLLKLPGLGPKMAHLFLQAADGRIEGIGVDVHVHRIVQRFQWVPQDVKSPEDTRKALERWLPREHWSEINHMLVGFGQTICTPRFPKCGACAVAHLCPSAFQERQSKSERQAAVDMEDIAEVPQKERKGKKVRRLED